jgi:hypothetical protein
MKHTVKKINISWSESPRFLTGPIIIENKSPIEIWRIANAEYKYMVKNDKGYAYKTDIIITFDNGEIYSLTMGESVIFPRAIERHILRHLSFYLMLHTPADVSMTEHYNMIKFCREHTEGDIIGEYRSWWNNYQWGEFYEINLKFKGYLETGKRHYPATEQVTEPVEIMGDKVSV